eukprot:m.81003 g.81003  ORF g.81003 m.81003 type:complete len:1041 (+) comp8639_c0_seq3:49-3171(+)
MGCSQSKATAEADSMTFMTALGYALHEASKYQEPKVSVMTGHWEVQRDRIDTDNIVSIGEGVFGPVYEVSIKGLGLTDAEVEKLGDQVESQPAVARQLTSTDDRDTYVMFLKELQFMKEIEHPHIMSLVGAVTQDSPLLMLVESFQHGSLKAFLKAHKSTLKKQPSIRFSMGECVASGLSFLAQQKTVHMDLAARNCRVTDKLVVKIADFGLSRTQNSSDYVDVIGYTHAMPLRWMAPELLDKGAKFTFESDVWALGITLWEIFTDGNVPYPTASLAEVHTGLKARDASLALKAPSQTEDGAQAILDACLVMDPNGRWKASGVRDRLHDLCAQHGGFNSRAASVVRKGGSLKPEQYFDPSFPEARLKAFDESIKRMMENIDLDNVEEVEDEDESNDGGEDSDDGDDVQMYDNQEKPVKHSPKSSEAGEKTPDMKLASGTGSVVSMKLNDSFHAASSLTRIGEGEDTEDESDGEMELDPNSPFAQAKKATPRTQPTPAERNPYKEEEEENELEEKEYTLTNITKVEEIPRKRLKLLDFLGKGAFGEVRKGLLRRKEGEVVCACKTLKSKEKEDLKALLSEALLVSQFNHPNVVHCYGQITKGDPPMIVFEFLGNGALQDWLVKHGPETSLDRKLQMSIDVARGMAYLSKNSFVHRDLASRNVLVGANLTCKISDFGLSRDLEDDTYYQSEGGMVPIRWTPPEAFQYRKYSTASDVWSYGILLYEILTDGKVPYGKQWTNMVVIVKVEGGYRLPPPTGCPRALYKVMMECWAPHRRKRPSFDIILTKLELAFDMMFAAETKKKNEDASDDCSNLENLYVGVPVPTLDNLDEEPGHYLAPTPMASARTSVLVPHPPIRHSLNQKPEFKNSAFTYSSDGTTAEFKKKDTSQYSANHGLDGLSSQSSKRDSLQRSASLRKQQVLGENADEEGIQYASNQQVSKVLEFAKQRETVSKAEEVGLSRLDSKDVQDVIQNREQFVERVGRATNVTAAKGIRGRKGCVCRRHKCVCNLNEEDEENDESKKKPEADANNNNSNSNDYVEFQ